MTDSVSTDIAIVGLACRFPGASTAADFWQLLHDGREARTELTDEELRKAGVPEELLSHPDYVKSGMFLQRMDQFDPGFFGFSPMDGRVMDPQHRHFLECSWEALEDAAYDPFRFDGAIGVFAGSGHNAYLPYNLLTNPQLVSDVGLFLLRHTGNDKDFLATRVSYCFNLKGPSINVQTACSTSLVAVHQAVQSLINGECDMALAGGVTIELPHRQGYLFKDSEILSRDGHCRPFDASAGGTVFGSGVGVVVLKRLQDAIDANDNIHAVIKASAVNNDGAGKISYLAPSVDGQAAAIAECLSIGDIDPATVTYIATHGTGTPIGDPIEVAALTQAYGQGQAKRCAIGSVKSNIGHTDTAAGVASLISVVLALKHREIPATLHYTAPNPAMDLPSTPFFVCQQRRDWTAPSPRRAGVSSLGVGGTNAHLVVEEAPSFRSGEDVRAPHLLLLSARSEAGLLRQADALGQFIDQHAIKGAALADAAYTLAVGRRAFNRRAFAVVTDNQDALRVLDGGERERLIECDAPGSDREVAFMFAGGGAQYPGMGQGLYETEPIYRAAIDECLEHFRHFADFDLKPLMFPADEAACAAAESSLERPSRALPALFATQYAQAQLWQSWGVTPSALIGHSMGENTAACLAGVLSLRDAMGLVTLRGQLFETVGEGSMLSVELDESALLPLIGPDLSVAAVNAPGLTAISGPKPALATLEARLDERGIGYRRIRIDVAAHSSMLDPILARFGDYLRALRMTAPTIPFISNLSGTWITPEEAVSVDYWVAHLRNTVRFADGLAVLIGEGRFVLLEVGPGRTLVSLAKAQARTQDAQVSLASLRHPDDSTPDVAHMLDTLGRLWQAGIDVNWTSYYEGKGRRRISLPTYQFEHIRCWIEPGHRTAETLGPSADARERRDSVEDWCYHTVWHRHSLPPATSLNARVLVLAGAHGVGGLLQATLTRAHADVKVVRIGSTRVLDAKTLQVRVEVADDYAGLVDFLRGQAWMPSHIVNLLPLELTDATMARSPEASRTLAFDALFHLVQAAGNDDWQDLRWLTVTQQAVQIAGEPILSPFGALPLGAMRVLPREFPSWRTRVVDIAQHDALSLIAEHCASELADAGSWSDADRTVAWRGLARLVQSIEPQPKSDTPANMSIRRDGVYLITGGIGGLGLAAAEALAAHSPAALVLTGRQAMPDEQHWGALADGEGQEAGGLAAILRMRALGVRVAYEVADVTDLDSLARLSERIRPLGPLRGIIHTAGVVDDGPVLSKDIQQCLDVLAAKVDGTLNIDRTFDGRTLDFVLLYSSSSAFQGLPGQVDYAAANAFLDAFAHQRSAEGARYVAINWPAWRQVGMAARADGPRLPRLPGGRPLDQPLLHRELTRTAEHSAFASMFNVADFWLLSEHRIKAGPALVPGAGFLELARASFCEHTATRGTAIEMRDVAFDAPFVVGDADRRVMRVDVGSAGFVLSSDVLGERVEHARGNIQQSRALDMSIDLEAIRARCARGRLRFSDPEHHPFLDFGERWRCLREVLVGEREALIELRMDDRFIDELAQFSLHPAMYDMATAGAQVVIDGYSPLDDLYVPIGCTRMVFNGALPAHAFSHVSYRPSGDGAHARDIARFDIAVSDASGRVVLTVDGFTLRRIMDPAALKTLDVRVEQRERPVLRRTLELGLDPGEGQAALLHVLRVDGGPQTIVSPYRPEFVTGELLRLAVPAPIAVPPSHDPDVDPDISTVETALGQCPAIDSVFIRAFKGSDDSRRLVAFFVPSLEHYTTVSEVRRFARAHLSPEFVPEQFVELDELPLLSNGSVDRTALRDPLVPQDTHMAPRTSIEKTIARVWQDTLGVERIGLADNFFDLGGHSLLSTRVIVQIFKRTGVRLDQPTMVLNTLEQIAREVEQRVTPAPQTPPSTTVLEQAAAAEPRKGRGLLQSLLGRP